MNETFTILVSFFYLHISTLFLNDDEMFGAPFRGKFFTIFIKKRLKSLHIHNLYDRVL